MAKRISPLAVISVRHNGTRFVKDYLLGDSGLTVLWNHVETGYMPVVREWAKTYPAIVPVRHPREVSKSWAAREWPEKGRIMPELQDCYRRLVTGILPHNPILLPIDSPIRDEYLDRMEAELDIPMKREWPQIGHCGATAELTPIQEEWAFDIFDELRSFFEPLGYSWP